MPNSLPICSASSGHLPNNLGRLLIVDDEATNREFLARLLEPAGYTTIQAESGQEALELISTQEFDSILLDINMPEMDGLRCLQVIRQLSDVPVIMITAESDRKTIVEAFRLGASDFIAKPIDGEITLARIATHTQLRKSVKALKRSEERYALAARGSNDGLWDWDITANKVFYSPRWKSLVGCNEHDIDDSPNQWWHRLHPEDVSNFQACTNPNQPTRPRTLNCELRMLHSDGSYRWMLCRGVYVSNEEGQIYRMAGSLTDITEGKVGDPLTGLPNRLLFGEMLERAIERAKRHQDSNFAVMFLDIDKFKLINDSLGHHAGDQLLMIIAQRLSECLRTSDCVAHRSPEQNGMGNATQRKQQAVTIARHAGDEFTVLLEDLKNPEDVEIVANRILEAVSQPVLLADQETVPTVSIGWSTGSSKSASADDLLRQADTAMYHAKSGGRNRCCGYDPTMRIRATLRLEMENDLRHALAEEQFFINYQPIISVDGQKTCGFEALVRWRHPEKGIVSPAEFIPTADDIGIIVPLGWWITEQAMRQAALWNVKYGEAAPYVTINCAVKQLYQPDFLTRFCDLIRQTGVPAHNICMEVTEGTLMDQPKVIRPILDGLREAGVKIAIDDFGTGYSSLAYLHRFPLDLIKIDGSFVQNMSTGDEHFEIIRTIIDLGRSLKLKTIAEGVETQDQFNKLKTLGCDLAQGYLISYPVSPSQADSFLENHLQQGILPESIHTEIPQLLPIVLPDTLTP